MKVRQAPSIPSRSQRSLHNRSVEPALVMRRRTLSMRRCQRAESPSAQAGPSRHSMTLSRQIASARSRDTLARLASQGRILGGCIRRSLRSLGDSHALPWVPPAWVATPMAPHRSRRCARRSAVCARTNGGCRLLANQVEPARGSRAERPSAEWAPTPCAPCCQARCRHPAHGSPGMGITGASSFHHGAVVRIQAGTG